MRKSTMHKNGEYRSTGVFFFFPFPPFLLFPAGNKLGKALSPNDPSQGCSVRKSSPWERGKHQYFLVDFQNKIKGTEKAKNEFIFSVTICPPLGSPCTLHVLCLYGLVYDYCGVLSVLCGTHIIFSLSNDL